MNWYFAVLKRYADFGGRASRTEFWMFSLFNFIILLALLVAGQAAAAVAILALVYILAIILPSFAVSARRLHDIDMSGWWLLLSFVPFGNLFLLVFFIQGSTPGVNRYGPNPWGEGQQTTKSSDQRMRELDSLRERALISQEEYEEERRQILEQV